LADASPYATTLILAMPNPERRVSLFREGGYQAVRIPPEFELAGRQALMRKEGDRLVITPIKPYRLLELLAQWEPLGDEFDHPEDTPVLERDCSGLGC
jgi:antitoxin VapB